MRHVLIVLTVAAALAGCASVRRGLGEYQAAADKGITIGGPPDLVGPETGGGGGNAAPASGKRPDLPGGLGGDKAHAQYTPQG